LRCSPEPFRAMGGPQGRRRRPPEPAGRSASGGPEPKAYLRAQRPRGDRASGRGNKPAGDGFGRPAAVPGHAPKEPWAVRDHCKQICSAFGDHARNWLRARPGSPSARKHSRRNSAIRHPPIAALASRSATAAPEVQRVRNSAQTASKRSKKRRSSSPSLNANSAAAKGWSSAVAARAPSAR